MPCHIMPNGIENVPEFIPVTKMKKIGFTNRPSLQNFP